eukprot:SAG11_NODE_26436_length_346_cov_0.898374_1_plen_31_part_01
MDYTYLIMDAERGEGHGFPPWDPEGELAIAD